MAHRNPPFRAEHLGSLLRPRNLLESRGEFDKAQTLPKDQQTAIEDAAIKDIVAKQEQWGYHALTDGEYRRHMFWGYFWPSLEGMTEIFNPPLEMFRQYVPDMAAFLEENAVPGESAVCTSKIRHPGKSSYEHEVRFVQGIVPRERWGEVKLTLAAPTWYHLRYKDGKAYDEGVYANDEEYFADIAKAYQVELDLLYKLGIRNVTIDDPNFAYFCSEKMIEGWAADKSNKRTLDELFDDYVKLYNDCIGKRPADMHIGLHICRGNFVNSRHFSEGGYDRIAVKLFQGINVDTYYLEYDTERAGSFEPLRHLPKNKNVILGVVTSKFPAMEDKEEMKQKVYAAAEVMAQGDFGSKEAALKNMGVSPQCGFASHAVGNLVSAEDMEKKLKLVRSVADEIWPGEP